MTANPPTTFARLARWHRITLLVFVVALLQTGIYAARQRQIALREARSAASARADAAEARRQLQSERQVTEGLKSCMTYDRQYIQSLEERLSTYEAPPRILPPFSAARAKAVP